MNPMTAAASFRRLITSKIYKLATGTDATCAFYNFVWRSYAPPKVKFFAWLLLRNRIQCIANLKDTDGCELCNGASETADHLITQCPFARSFWRHIGWNPDTIPAVAQLWTVTPQGCPCSLSAHRDPSLLLASMEAQAWRRLPEPNPEPSSPAARMPIRSSSLALALPNSTTA
jgi:hypothetical protein